jgi:hypothetical protein
MDPMMQQALMEMMAGGAGGGMVDPAMGGVDPMMGDPMAGDPMMGDPLAGGVGELSAEELLMLLLQLIAGQGGDMGADPMAGMAADPMMAGGGMPAGGMY